MNICIVDGCGLPSKTKGKCNTHYMKDHRAKMLAQRPVLEETPFKKGKAPKFCTLEGCDKKHASRGYCDTHYRNLLKYGTPVSPWTHPTKESNPNWKGGVSIGNFYTTERVYSDDPLFSMADSTGRVPQHRLVMARSLGRPLLSSETVHHINGDGHDNRLQNLQLRQGNHGPGAKYQCYDCGSHNIGGVEL